jgi:glucosamine kinase
MILLADSGSTKTDWTLIDTETGNYTAYSTIGFNPYLIDSVSILLELEQMLVPQLSSTDILTIYFYGAGCSTPNKKGIVLEALQKAFPQTQSFFIDHDLLGSARALLGNKKGFAAILGTGANTCIYNGTDCEPNIDSLGYLLGDEGSGCYIGKKLIRDYMRKQMPDALRTRFKERFNIESHEQVFNTLYNAPRPNRYLASFCKFTDEYTNHPYINQVVSEAFTDFFTQLVSKYPNYTDYSFNCVGSVAFYFKDILTQVAEAHNMKIGRIIQSPMEGLIEFHTGKI